MTEHADLMPPLCLEELCLGWCRVGAAPEEPHGGHWGHGHLLRCPPARKGGFCSRLGSETGGVREMPRNSWLFPPKGTMPPLLWVLPMDDETSSIHLPFSLRPPLLSLFTYSMPAPRFPVISGTQPVAGPVNHLDRVQQKSFWQF